jgi:hypothetical protein
MGEPDPPDGVDTETVRRAMRRILQAEQDKLHMDSPTGINNEIQSIIEDEVQE